MINIEGLSASQFSPIESVSLLTYDANVDIASDIEKRSVVSELGHGVLYNGVETSKRSPSTRGRRLAQISAVINAAMICLETGGYSKDTGLMANLPDKVDAAIDSLIPNTPSLGNVAISALGLVLCAGSFKKQES